MKAKRKAQKSSEGWEAWAAAALKDAAAQLEALVELREAAAIVVRSYDPAERPKWPAIVVLDEALERLEAKR